MTGPGSVGAAVVAASPSGLTGLIAEAAAMGKVIRESVSAQSRTPLMEAMAAELLGTAEDFKEIAQQQEKAKDMEDARNKALEGVRQALYLVSSKASPADADAYRQMLLKVADETAAAAKEGGFLGFGGEQINDKERDVLAEIKNMIGAAPASSTSTAVVTQETPPIPENK